MKNILRRTSADGAAAASPVPLDELVLKLRRRVNRTVRRLDGVEKTVNQAARDAQFHATEMRKIGPAVAAIEARLEDRRQEAEPAPVVHDAAELEEARDLLAQMRREHEQIRARLTALSRYEDRLRRLEERFDLPHE